jgi:hypothetical protein
VKRIKYIIGFLLIFSLIILGGCGHKTAQHTKTVNTNSLNGVYRTVAKSSDGKKQKLNEYWYFNKNGKLKYCVQEGNNQHGSAKEGTWKSLGNHKYQLKFHDVYDHDSYTIKAKLNGKSLHTYANGKDAKYLRPADDNTRIKMSYSKFMKLFNAAKDADQKYVQQYGYAQPSNGQQNENAQNNQDTNNAQQVNNQQSQGSNDSSLSGMDRARQAMTNDPNVDPEFKRRINLPEDDPDFIPATHDPESWKQ